VGVIVAVDAYKEKKIYTLDDGSGCCVECVAIAPPELEKKEGVGISGHLNFGVVSKSEPVKGNNGKEKGKKEEGNGGNGKGEGGKKELGVDNPSVPWEEVDVGGVVKVKGRVGVHWTGAKLADVVKIEIVGCTDGEVKHWNEAGAFKREVLGKEWVVTPEMEKKCRKRRDRELRHKRKGKGKETEKDEDRKRGKEDNHEKGKRKRDEADAVKRIMEEE